MTSRELQEVETLFGTYRGTRLEDEERDEFATLYGRADHADVESAIRAAAELDGRVFLETVARRHREIRDAKMARYVAEKRAERCGLKTPAVDHARPGWPCAAGSPTGTYLGWIAVRAMLDMASAKRTGERYVAHGFVLSEHVEELLASVVPIGALPALDRSKRTGDAIKAIERGIGSWVKVRAEEYVAAARAEQGLS